jgi:hypothetical protein
LKRLRRLAMIPLKFNAMELAPFRLLLNDPDLSSFRFDFMTPIRQKSG